MISARPTILRALGSALAICSVIGCATPGPPEPPSLKIPKPVADLKAAKSTTGGGVVLSWTAPKETTDEENLRRLGKTSICRDFQAGDPIPSDRCTVVAEAPSLPGSHQEYTDAIPADVAQKTGLLVYHVRVSNPAGRTDDLSKPTIVPIAPTLPSPAAVSVEASRSGVRVAWPGTAAPPVEGVGFFYSVLRQDAGAGAAQWKEIGRTPAANQPLSYQDTTPEFGHDYDYAVAPLSRFALAGQEYEVRGALSAPQAVAFRDVFPPAAPARLQAVYAGVPGQDAIDLSWNPEQERDLAGYNVYRREQGGTPARVNGEVLVAPACHDSNVTAGHRYFYTVTAVDSHGVESKPSAEASEMVPAAAPQ